MTASTAEMAPSTPDMNYLPEVSAQPDLIDRIPERYRESLLRTQSIAEMVGTELEVVPVDSMDDIPQEPGVFIFPDQAQSPIGDIKGARFALDTELLSGKADSAHAVLPGLLSLRHKPNGKMAETHIHVAAKGYYKRGIADRFSRVATEVRAAHAQREMDEVSYSPIAVVVAPPEYKGKGTDESEYELLLITKLDESTASLDNAPWALGFREENLHMAELAVAALGRFNASVGRHGDAKVKNVVQRPDGKTSMIDFETSQDIDRHDPLDASITVHEDLGKLFDSMAGLGFFAQEPHRAREVLDQLAEDYLGHWSGASAAAQDAVYEAAVQVVDGCVANLTAF